LQTQHFTDVEGRPTINENASTAEMGTKRTKTKYYDKLINVHLHGNIM